MIYPALLLFVCCRLLAVPAKDACEAGDGDCTAPASNSDDSGEDDTLLFQMRSDRPPPPEASSGSRGASLVAADYPHTGFHEKPPLKEVPITPEACTAIQAALGTSLASGPWSYLCSREDVRKRMSPLTNGCFYVPSDSTLQALFSKVDRLWPFCFIYIFEGSFFPTMGACPNFRPGEKATSLGGGNVTACSGGLLSKKGDCMPAAELGRVMAPLNVTVFELDGWVMVPEHWSRVMEGSRRPHRARPLRAAVNPIFTSPTPLGAIPVHYYICGGASSPIWSMSIGQQVLESQTEVMNKGFGGTDTCSSGTTSYTPQKFNTRIAFATASGSTIPYDGCDSDCESASGDLLQDVLRQEQYMAKVLICDGLNGILGFVTDFPGDSTNRLTVIWSGSLPGGSGAPYNLGKTLTHEMGHYLGLYHTFQVSNLGLCVFGDQVLDTNNEAFPAYGCPSMRRTCDGSLDPVHNFMDYVDDDCMCSFTQGQHRRVSQQLFAHQTDLFILALLNAMLSLLCCM